MRRVLPDKNRALFDALAEGWDTAHGPDGPDKKQFAARLDYLRALCRQRPRPRVLDVGCGTGLYLVGLSDLIAEGVGIDFSPRMIALASARTAASNSRGKLHFIIADAERLSQHALGRFDLVFLIGVLEHLQQPQHALRAIRDRLAPGGEVIVIMRHPRHPAAVLARTLGKSACIPWHRHLSERELASVARQAGLQALTTSAVGTSSCSVPNASCSRNSWQTSWSLWPSRVYAARFADHSNGTEPSV